MTTHRTIDPYAFFANQALEHRPAHVFTGRNRGQFAAWKKRVLPQVLATLGAWPRRTPANPQRLAAWREDGIIKERWVIDTQPGLSAIVLIYRPASLRRGERRPALLCCHGHGPTGKDAVMGLASPDQIKTYNYDYGLQMAKAGFVTYALDWLGFGERDSQLKPHNHNVFGHRDPCNVYYLCATMLGTTLLAMNLHDARCTTDFVCDQPYVDADNLGVMGLSLGGTMTTWSALADERFKAADIICYAGPFYDIAYRTYNVCGSQVTPGIFALVDTPELQGLIAPRPLLAEIGIHDKCFHVDHTLGEHHKRLERIYKAAGAELELDLFPGTHAWGGNKSVAFFRKHLGGQW
jgi:dienelactone hydrolase